ncbi:hypothetical protein HY250_03205 [Candidatus Azambacteria bacterium]|nr:hypothetical protein [Candidatus Azambacteria bacterium]
MTWITVFVSVGATLAVVGILLFFSPQKRYRRRLRKQLRKDELRCPKCFEQLYCFKSRRVIGSVGFDGVFEETLVCLNDPAFCSAVGLLLTITYRDRNLDRSACGHRHPKLVPRLPKDQVEKMRSAHLH